MRLLLAALALSSLTACALFERKPDVAIVVPEKIQLNPESLVPCAKLKEFTMLENDMAPFITLLETIKDNAIIYNECAAKQSNSITLLKKFSNTKEPR